MHDGTRRHIVTGLVLADIVALAAALTLAYRLAVPWRFAFDNVQYLLLLATGIPMGVALFALHRLYVLDELLEGSTEYSRLTYACTLIVLGLITVDFWGANLGELVPSRRLIAVIWLTSLAMVGTFRFAGRRIIRFLRRRGIFVSRALIVGTGGSGLQLARHFQVTKHAGIQVAGFVDDFLPAGTPVGDGLRVLGPPSRLGQLIREAGASEVIVVPTAMAWESFQDLIRTVTGLNGHSVRLAPDFRDVLATSVKVHQFGFTPLLTIERVRITGLDAVMKMTLDYGLALLLLPVALPLVAVLSAFLAIAGIPPFTSVRALGRGGKLFRAFLLNTESPSSLSQVLHQTGIDRLPLLLNVVLGRMSMVGPRLIPEASRRAHEPWLPNLLTVKPGITGPWFVRVLPSLTDEMQLNIFYIRNYTIWLDVELLFRSIIRIFTGRPGREDQYEAVSHERAAISR